MHTWYVCILLLSILSVQVFMLLYSYPRGLGHELFTSLGIFNESCKATLMPLARELWAFKSQISNQGLGSSDVTDFSPILIHNETFPSPTSLLICL